MEPTQQDPLSTVNHITYERAIMLSYGLLESAMRYRECFWREQCETFKNDLIAETSRIADIEKWDRNRRRRAIKAVEDQAAKYTAKIEAFNKTIYNEIERMEKTLSDRTRLVFDSYATTCGEIMEEFAACDNPRDFKLICKLHNMGITKEAIDAYKAHFGEQLQRENEGKDNVGPPIIMPEEVKLEVVKSPILDANGDPYDNHSSD